MPDVSIAERPAPGGAGLGRHRSVLVIGGGIAGITAAVEAAEAGYDAIIVEKSTHLGGRVAQLNKYFPKLCPPYCGLEINFQRIRKDRGSASSPWPRWRASAAGPGASTSRCASLPAT